jgi:hypothetical protein
MCLLLRYPVFLLGVLHNNEVHQQFYLYLFLKMNFTFKNVKAITLRFIFGRVGFICRCKCPQPRLLPPTSVEQKGGELKGAVLHAPSVTI